MVNKIINRFTERQSIAVFSVMMGLLLALAIFIRPHFLTWNPDEEANFEIAKNVAKGLGYIMYFDDLGTYKLASFHASFPVYVYSWLIKLDVSKNHFAIFLHILTIVAHGFSVWFFYWLARLFSENQFICFIAALIYATYPSVLFFIGNLFWYERLTMPVLVIILYKLIRILKTQKITTADFVLFPVLITLSCLFREYLLLVYGVIFGAVIIGIWFAFYQINKVAKKKFVLISLLIFGLLFSAHLPILIKHKKMFGAYILSTQSGFEFLQGHNPHASGKWHRNWRTPGDDFYEYTQTFLSGKGPLNQFEESEIRKNMAVNWILQNPGQELKLIWKKMCLYFLPHNFRANFYSPVNFVVHAAFLLLLAAVFLIFRGINKYEFLILLPMFATLIICVVFFVLYRIRYHAEPFMILFVLLSAEKLYLRFKNKPERIIDS